MRLRLAGAGDRYLAGELDGARDAFQRDPRGLNLQALRMLDERGLFREQPAETYAWIVRKWQFPLYTLDLSKIEVALDSLRERQRSWSPEAY